MNMYPSLRSGLFAALLTAVGSLPSTRTAAQAIDTNVSNYADRILGRPTSNTNVVDRNSDTAIDVRDLVLYVNGLPLTAWFATPESSALSYKGMHLVEALFTRPVTGVFAYDVGGNAATNRDFETLSGQLNLNNAYSTLIPIQIKPSTSLRGPRSIVLTLKSPASNVVSRIVATPTEGLTNLNRYSAHVITLHDADQGLYTGTLSFHSRTTRTVQNGQTNVTIMPAPPVPPSTFQMALRSGPPDSAVVEIPECILFTNRFSIPVSLAGNNLGFSSASPVSGVTTLAQLQSRSVAWQLEFTSITFTNQGTLFDAECRITLNGLTASGIPKILNGTISASRIDP